MAKKKAAPNAEQKRKRVSISPIKRSPTETAYQILDYLLGQHHDELSEATIMLAYQMSDVREDADGMIGFGRVKRGNDLDRAYAKFDFVFLIPHSLWQNSDEVNRHAILDWMLCQCAVVKDKHGEPTVDEENRTVYRIRKPIKVFPENVGRFGLWQSNAVADAIERYEEDKRPLLKQARKTDAKRGAGSKKKSAAKRAAENGHTDDVLADLNVLGVPAPIVEACRKVDLHTVQDVERYVDANGEVGLADINGMGSERAQALLEAIQKHASVD